MLNPSCINLHIYDETMLIISIRAGDVVPVSYARHASL